MGKLAEQANRTSDTIRESETDKKSGRKTDLECTIAGIKINYNHLSITLFIIKIKRNDPFFLRFLAVLSKKSLIYYKLLILLFYLMHTCQST